jgi:hypothetical protein
VLPDSQVRGSNDGRKRQGFTGIISPESARAYSHKPLRDRTNSLGVVKDDAERVAVARAQTAHAVAHIDAVCAAFLAFILKPGLIWGWGVF